ncbi:MAG: hypothetical protein Q8R04_06510 [Nanoarchaeota archaeon]|nr:hypothetical protein [Nanoarchaeota archaeon]
MPTIEMFVSLKVPDNVAITAFNTLKKMGYDELIALERSDYYKFEISGDEKKFKDEISKVDILINANKHKFLFSIEKNKDNKNSIVNVLVQDLDNGSGLLSVLKERLGFKNIKKIEKGVLWAMHFKKDADAEKNAVDITKNLLMNENYQKFKILQ